MVYAPGTLETDQKKQNMALQQQAKSIKSNTTDIATNTANIATNTAAIATNTASIAANTAAIAALRQKLSASTTYYVRTDGSDSNNGLANTSAGAFLTIQKAVDTVCSVDLSIYQATIQVGNGTYTGGVSFGNWVGKLYPIVQGDTATPSNVIINPTSSDCFLNDGKLPWDVRGFQLKSTTGGSQLRGKAGGTIYFRSLDFAASAGSHIWFEAGAKVICEGNYTISGSPGGDGIHVLITDGAVGKFDSITVTVSGSPSFIGSFASASRNGTLRAASSTYTGGTPTGARYSASLNGVIYTAGGGANYFPGNAAGSTATGGQYA